jgi:hypothetical protein
MPVSHLLVAGAALVLQTVGRGAVAVKVRPGLCHLCTRCGFHSSQTFNMGLMLQCLQHVMSGWVA